MRSSENAQTKASMEGQNGGGGAAGPPVQQGSVLPSLDLQGSHGNQLCDVKRKTLSLPGPSSLGENEAQGWGRVGQGQKKEMEL